MGVPAAAEDGGSQVAPYNYFFISTNVLLESLAIFWQLRKWMTDGSYLQHLETIEHQELADESLNFSSSDNFDMVYTQEKQSGDTR